MHDLAEFFGPDSPLKAKLPGFQPREGQAWMAEAVADTLDNLGQLVVEAGTGTGKTFAYLLPALQNVQTVRGPVTGPDVQAPIL